MGVYLSSPVTDKESIIGKGDKYVYGASSMQGWRITQEDAHNCIPEFDDKSKTSFFAVYDGHGGPEVAKYCERHFPDFMKELINSTSSQDLGKVMQQAFLAFDATLTNEDVIKELKELAGKDDEPDDEEEEDPVGRTETDRLKEEANMPLEQLLAQYKPNVQSPALRGKGVSRTAAKQNGESSQQGSQVEPGDQPSSSSSSIPQPSSSSALSSSSSSSSGLSSEAAAAAASSSSSSSSSSTEQAVSSSSLPNGKVNSNEEAGGSAQTSAAEGSNKCNNNNVKGKTEVPDNAAGSGGSSTKSEVGGSSGRASKERAAAGMAEAAPDSSDDDDDDDDEEEDEEMWEEMSGEDDDDDDDDDEEEENNEDVPMMDMTNEEPGSDSGCTACVLLMQDKKLIVANSGDSRCVLSRGGSAVELSFDHKPEDQEEKDRIEKAGGKVTADGRVNGGLNLSRAIGDHVYKRNAELPAKDQMITALPDIETAELCDQDQFLVIACDGIWNYMSSQEVVDYVLSKLRDPEKRQNPSLICEDLFDNCLAPNTYGDGTGCDNMTCIIIVLDSFVAPDPDPEEVKVKEEESKKSGHSILQALKSSESSGTPDTTSSTTGSSAIGGGGETSGSTAGGEITGSAATSTTTAVGTKRCGEDVDGGPEKRTKREEEVV